MTIAPGQSVAILGQNGSGKSTLLHALQGIFPADHGSIRLLGRALSSWSRREIAQRVGLLLQHSRDEMPSRVDDFAMLGRLPHADFWRSDSPQDRRAVAQALRDTGLTNLSARDVDSLSGGERQRLAIAMILTQDPALYLLDEPGNHLDIAHQIGIMALLQQQIKTRQKAMVFATHDMNLAARFADQVLLLDTEAGLLFGQRDEVMTETNLGNAYNHPVKQAKTETAYPVFFPG